MLLNNDDIRLIETKLESTLEGYLPKDIHTINVLLKLKQLKIKEYRLKTSKELEEEGYQLCAGPDHFRVKGPRGEKISLSNFGWLAFFNANTTEPSKEAAFLYKEVEV